LSGQDAPPNSLVASQLWSPGVERTILDPYDGRRRDEQRPMERSISMPLGVVVERRELDNPWQRFAWKPVAVIPGAPPITLWRELARGERFVRWHAATLPLELHRTETEAYRVNLAGRSPSTYVVLRRTEPSEQTAGNDIRPFLVTASPYEAEGYLEGDDMVEAVSMPEALIAWVHAFVDRHHVDQPFVKRKRKRAKAENRDAGDREAGDPAPRAGQRGTHG
jgi:Protein of unknown function (DUF3305)